MVMTRTHEGWSEPQPVSFSYDCFEFEPFLTRDNQHLYYISQRPLSGEGKAEDYQLWMVSRVEDGWCTPERVTDLGDFYPSITDAGVMYFTDAQNDLCRSVLIDGRPGDREKLDDSVNTPSAEYNSYIAADESYLLFTSHGWGNSPGPGVLYASRRDQKGAWSQPIDLGSGVNGSNLSYCPSLSPDGKYLFFAMRNGAKEDIYWVEASLVDHARTEDLDFRRQLLDLVIDSGLASFESHLPELKARMSDYCELNANLLNSVSDRLLAAGHDAEAAGLLRMTGERFLIPASPMHSLKLAILEQDHTLWQQTIDALVSDSPVGIEPEINLLGYLFLGAGRTNDAARLFQLNTEIFPTSANVYDSYGEVLLATADTLGAIENYRRSLELNPDNINATRVLERLGSN